MYQVEKSLQVILVKYYKRVEIDAIGVTKEQGIPVAKINTEMGEENS